MAVPCLQEAGVASRAKGQLKSDFVTAGRGNVRLHTIVLLIVEGMDAFAAATFLAASAASRASRAAFLLAASCCASRMIATSSWWVLRLRLSSVWGAEPKMAALLVDALLVDATLGAARFLERGGREAFSWYSSPSDS